MDATNPSAIPTWASRTPIHIGATALAVRDLDRMSRFYAGLLGLSELENTGSAIRLGVNDTTIVALEHKPDALPDDPRQAGLYHNAFLMPTRGDLARWLTHVARRRVPLTGASDHLVSEAIYLDDPEGNGIEVYVDRPPETWDRKDGGVRMTTDPLDIDDLVMAADGFEFMGAPGGLRVGHVHLRVGDVEQAAHFYNEVIGLDLTRTRFGAAFLSNGGYHHHVAGNIWHSQGAGQRDPQHAGLAWFEFEVADAETEAALKARLDKAGVAMRDVASGFAVADPWGTQIRVVRR